MSETGTPAAAAAEREFAQLTRAAVRFIESVARAGLVRDGGGGTLSAELLESGLAAGALEFRVAICISGAPRVELYAVAGDQAIRLLAIEGRIGEIDPRMVN